MSEQSPARPLTLAEVAEAAGVAISTVSKVINQRSDVAPATRERILRLMSEKGYVINRAGQSLRKGRSGQIDFIVQSLNSDYAAEILRGVEDALSASDKRVVLVTTNDHQQRERDWAARLADGSTDGAILVASDNASQHLEELKRRAVPFVVVDPVAELDADDFSISATNFIGGRTATQYLLNLGHRRIATLQGPLDFRSTRDRLSGYRVALQEAGIVVDPNLVLHGDWHFETAYKKTLQLLDLPEPPTAIFVGTDQQVLGVYRALYERNMRVPDAMSVVGFDDMPYARWLTPALTTVRQPLSEMGRVATSILLRLISGEAIDMVGIELTTQLIKRSSCSPPGSPARSE